ncbi:MAG: ParA family protein [Chloroflexi bacterium]|nr:ParA family protein [Chloroflexota bacterium]
MACIYTLANQKGGVGKTTTTVSLCAYLASAGKRVLLVDMDPQANATSSLGIDRAALAHSIYDVLTGSLTSQEALLITHQKGLDLLPSTQALAGADIELTALANRESLLQRALQPLLPQYDFIMIDTPPSLGLLTVNALVAADGVIIPVQCEYLPLEGLAQLLQTIEMVRHSLNPRLRVRGLLMTMYDPRTRLSREVADDVRARFPHHTFETIIPRSVRLSEAPSFGEPIGTYAPDSAGAQAYEALVEEFLSGEPR